MPSIPLPFVSSILLIILLTKLVSQREPGFRNAIIFVGACTTLTVVVGLRWSFDVRWLRFLQPVIASSLPPIAWYCFSGLVEPPKRSRILIHVAPVGVISILSASWPVWHPPIDLLLAVLFMGYGFALVRLGMVGSDRLLSTRLSDVATARKATLVAGLILTGSGLVDLLIAGDFGFYQGVHVALIVGMANMVSLPVIAYAVASVGTSITLPDAWAGKEDSAPDNAADSIPSEPSRSSTADDARVVDVIDTILRAKQQFRNPDLTLNRLARKAGIPARRISNAVNRIHGRSVSQVVNEYRIEEAKNLLVQSDAPITTIMFEVGFQTKSNFNREFLRVTGMSPSDFRRANSPYSGQ